MARDFNDEDPGCANRQTRQHLGQAHRKAPSLQAQATATSSAPRNRNISTTAEIPTSATTTAHGYMNNISTSKARKTIEARYQRAWNRSEERRVGKECKYRRTPHPKTKNKYDQRTERVRNKRMLAKLAA